MNNYLEDVGFLVQMISEYYPRLPYNEFPTKELLRQRNAEIYGVNLVLKECNKDLTIDPMVHLEYYENEMEIASLFAKQEINKLYYDHAAKAITHLKDLLKEKRYEQ